MSSDAKPPVPVIDMLLFWKNQDAFPSEQLVSYWGEQVAWTLDGTRILAGADTSKQLDEVLASMGVGPSEVVYGYVDDPNLVQF